MLPFCISSFLKISSFQFFHLNVYDKMLSYSSDDEKDVEIVDGSETEDIDIDEIEDEETIIERRRKERQSLLAKIKSNPNHGKVFEVVSAATGSSCTCLNFV
jgi:hypothetical protein